MVDNKYPALILCVSNPLLGICMKIMLELYMYFFKEK